MKDLKDSYEVIYCQKCGAKNMLQSSFCSNCGTAMYLNEPKKHGQSENEIYSDLALLVGKNFEYYIPKFKKLISRNANISWNWCAFLFTPYWMIYRKMYGYGIAYICFNLLISFLSKYSTYVTCFGYAVDFLFGLCGNRIYLNSLETRVHEMSKYDDKYKAVLASKNGGTNTAATIIAILVELIIYAAIAYVTF